MSSDHSSNRFIRFSQVVEIMQKVFTFYRCLSFVQLTNNRQACDHSVARNFSFDMSSVARKKYCNEKKKVGEQ